MTFTLKKDIDINSMILQHEIVLHATMLLQGREGVLETEKKIYLMIALIDAIIEEDLLQMCNDDSRELITILGEEVEPFFNKLKTQNKDYATVYDYLVNVLLDNCDQLWEEEYSIVGVIDAILTTIGAMSDDDKKEALEATGKLAEQAFDRRTEQMTKQATQVNDKLEALVQQYQRINNKQTSENDTK